MFGKFQRCAAVADGEIGLAKRPGALAELLLQRPVLHLVDEIERPRPDLGLARQHDLVGRGGCGCRQQPESCGKGGAMAGRHGWHLG